MGASTFSGPVRAGNIANTTGTTVGTDIANVGYMVMAQSAAFTQASGVTTVVIPANSQILSIAVNVTTEFTGVATTFGVGTTASATFLTAAAAVDGAAFGIVAAAPGDDATRAANWVDVGTTDRKIAVTSTNTGSGAGVITVQYVQALNLTA
jgi:predicted nucleotidyltransferase